jgi:hypothetical protein
MLNIIWLGMVGEMRGDEGREGGTLLLGANIAKQIQYPK